MGLSVSAAPMSRPPPTHAPPRPWESQGEHVRSWWTRPSVTVQGAVIHPADGGTPQLCPPPPPRPRPHPPLHWAMVAGAHGFYRILPECTQTPAPPPSLGAEAPAQTDGCSARNRPCRAARAGTSAASMSEPSDRDTVTASSLPCSYRYTTSL